MTILRYNESGPIFEETECENVRTLMGVALNIILFDEDLGFQKSKEKADVVVIMKVLKKLLENQTAMEAFAAEDFSALMWWDD